MRWIQGLEAGQAEARAEIAAVQAESADAEGRVAVLEDKIEALEAENAHLESMKVPCFPTSEETKDCWPGDLTLEVLASLCAATSLLRTCLTQRLLQEERACFEKVSDAMWVSASKGSDCARRSCLHCHSMPRGRQISCCC